MIVKQRICIALGLLLLVGVAAAIDLSPSAISNSNTGWLVADTPGAQQSTITVKVLSPGYPSGVPGAIVAFSLDAGSTGLGTLSPASVTTGPDGTAQAIFSGGTRSGNATILATITYPLDSSTATLSTFQRIDHNIPYYPTYSYIPYIPVNGTTGIEIFLKDRFGNPIDSLNTADPHDVTLTTSSSYGEGFVKNGSIVSSVVLHPDTAGMVYNDYHVGTVSQTYYFRLQPLGTINDPPQPITATAETVPAYILQNEAYPPGIPYPALPADGGATHYFTIDYILYDKYGNPVNSTLSFVGNDGTTATILTNPFTGMARAYFGPKTVTGDYILTVSTPANASVVCLGAGSVGSCNQTVQFYNTDPVDISLTANPISMASLETDPNSKAIISAKVVDMKGNPVANEHVYFTNESPTHPGGPYNVTQQLTLSAPDAYVTNGSADITFKPEAFASYTSPGYVSNATGQVVVDAAWTDRTGKTIIRNVTLIWKNYPYLSVSSGCDCANKAVGDGINVSVRVSGDGAAMRAKPIDAVMGMDVSGSMANAMDGHTKLWWANSSGQTFVSKMDDAQDQVGLTTYTSYNDATYTKVVYPLGNNFASVITDIKAMTSHGTTATRDGLKLALKDAITHKNSNPNTIQAVILMTDGAYNDDGDPLARDPTYKLLSHTGHSWGDGDKYWYNFSDLTPSEQNLAYYASEHHIRIYTVTFGTDAAIQPGYTGNGTTSWQIYNTMDLLASQTGGQHFHATKGSDLVDVYTTIAGLLRDTAGGDTNISFDLGTVNVFDTSCTNTSMYVNYSYWNSTYGTSASTYWNKSKLNLDGSRTIQSQGVNNDESTWPSTNKITFPVGTIKLNESYFVNIRLNLTNSTKLGFFGPTSLANVTFKDASTNATQTSFFPYCECPVSGGHTPPKNGSVLALHDLHDDLAGSIIPGNQWVIHWTTDYNGDDTDTVTEDVWVYNTALPSRGVSKVDFGSVVFIGKVSNRQDTLIIPITDTVKWPEGDQYCVYVSGQTAFLANRTPTPDLCRTKPGSTNGEYIKLE